MTRTGSIVLGVIATLVVGVLAVPLPIFGSLGHILYYRISWKLFPIDPTRPVYNEIGYYRVVAETMVDDEALKLDVVVRCVEQKLPGRYRHLRIPYLYGLRTKGNHTVIMHTPDLCYSIEQVGQPPKAVARFAEDYLPLMFWGENADDLEEFTAYTAEAAYTHKKARMTRPKVRATVATAAEYAAWQKVSAAKNILLSVPRDPFGSDYDLPPVWPKGMPVPDFSKFGLTLTGEAVPAVRCNGIMKLPLATGHQEFLRRRKEPPTKYWVHGFYANIPQDAEVINEQLRVLSLYWSNDNVLEAYEFMTSPGRRTEHNLFHSAPLSDSNSYSDFRKTWTAPTVARLSFKTTSDAHWGTMLCARSMLSLWSELGPEPTLQELIIDGISIAKSQTRPQNILGIILDDNFAWRPIFGEPTFRRGRLR